MKDELPVMQVYHQEKFVADRENQIKQIHSDAKEVRDIAGQINEEIYKQEDKLGMLNKDMSKQLDDVKESNKELNKAQEITAARNKSVTMWTIFAFILALVLGLSVYFMFFNSS